MRGQIFKQNRRTKESTDPKAPASSKSVLRSAPPGARTLDTLIKSQVLYQLS